MYNITNKNNQYYFYNLKTNTKTFIGDEDALVDFVINRFSKTRYWSSNRKIIDYSEVNFSGNDVGIFSIDFFHSYSTIRPSLFLDGENRIVDIRNYQKLFDNVLFEHNKKEKEKQEIIKEYGLTYYYNNYRKEPNICKEYEYNDLLEYRYSSKPKICYRYRVDPVPYTYKRKGGPSQKKNVGRIIHMVKHPDFEKYGRKSHYEDLLTNIAWYEYGERHRDKCWKNNKKIKKQWQKNLH